MKKDHIWFKDVFKRDLKIFWPRISKEYGEEAMAESFIEYLDDRIRQRLKTGNAIIRENKDNINFRLANEKTGNDVLQFISAIVEYVLYTMDVSDNGKELLKEKANET